MVRDKYGYIKPQATVWNIVCQHFNTGAFSYQDIVFALKSTGADVVEEMPQNPKKTTITIKQIRNVLNRNSFRKNELPENVWRDDILQKLGRQGWYTWGRKNASAD